jgi:hypothetical protein
MLCEPPVAGAGEVGGRGVSSEAAGGWARRHGRFLAIAALLSAGLGVALAGNQVLLDRGGTDSVIFCPSGYFNVTLVSASAGFGRDAGSFHGFGRLDFLEVPLFSAGPILVSTELVGYLTLSDSDEDRLVGLPLKLNVVLHSRGYYALSGQMTYGGSPPRNIGASCNSLLFLFAYPTRLIDPPQFDVGLCYRYDYRRGGGPPLLFSLPVLEVRAGTLIGRRQSVLEVRPYASVGLSFFSVAGVHGNTVEYTRR